MSTDPTRADIHALSGAYAVDALDETERAEFERHLTGCPSCRDEVDDLRDIESGRDAGTRTAAVRYGYIHPQDNPNNWGADVVVDHPLELRKVIDSALCGC